LELSVGLELDTNRFIVKKDETLIINREFAGILEKNGLTTLADFLRPDKQASLREKVNRTIQKVELSGRTFYLKRHRGGSPADAILALIGIRERTSPGLLEFKNNMLLEKKGLPVMKAVGCGQKRRRLSYGESFFMSEEIPSACPLDDYLKREFAPPLSKEKLKQKRKIIVTLGELLRKFHRLGFNHRDLYLCHLFIRPKDGGPALFIIDLQRVQQRKFLRQRWLVKDIAQLNYSSRFEGVTDRDRMRFLRSYFGEKILSTAEKKFIRKVIAKTQRMERKIKKRKLKAPEKYGNI